MKKIKAMFFSLHKGIYELIFMEKISDEDFREFLDE